MNLFAPSLLRKMDALSCRQENTRRRLVLMPAQTAQAMSRQVLQEKKSAATVNVSQAGQAKVMLVSSALQASTKRELDQRRA